MYTSLPAATTDATCPSVPHVELGVELSADACVSAGSKHSHPSATASIPKAARPDRPCITSYRRRAADAMSTRITAPYIPASDRQPHPPTLLPHTTTLPPSARAALSSVTRFDHVRAAQRCSRPANTQARGGYISGRTTAARTRVHPTAPTAKQKLRSEDIDLTRRLAVELDHDHPGAAASLREGMEETLTVTRLGITASSNARCSPRTRANP